MYRFLTAISALIIVVNSNAQDYQIEGFAPDFVGEKVTLYTYQDYITMEKIKLAEGEVSPADSLFHLDLNIGTTIKGLIEVGRTEAPIYLAPKSSYAVYFPKPEEQVISFQNSRTDIMFFGLDSTDINYRILQYHMWFDEFVAYNESAIARGQFLAYLDTFSIYAADAYKDVEDEYFITYVRYNIAELQQTVGGSSRSNLRLNTFLTYLQPFPVYYENDQYMKFFKGFYSRRFADFPPLIEDKVNEAIAEASPTHLMQALKQDLFLSNPEVRELVMVDKLGKQFYERPDQKRNILIILDSVIEHAKYPVNSTIAANVQNFITNLEPGFPAPYISLKPIDAEEENITWRKYEGKFVYFNFFETWNDQAKVDMKIIQGLKTKYGDYISFLTVCTNEKKADFDAYLKANPEFDWDIVYIGKDSELKSDFRVTNVPAYYLIDQSGFIAMAPAPTPSPDAEYESIDQTFFFIKKALMPKDGKRVGEP
ncbi:hypothetical protein K6119_17065 [Paracrocinitomix mangrovi]|uniref:TlpA family protein disulfide reductase n=1 Tax=Paracrocinitomix mangrovi TaxID=2862509 RepID=UPI001C8DBAC2|nr:thioredoxin-like domain-containing protein [Paracrocinitomix mangrovi]UKN01438.1 hypothetical protein K6119_17065 [Paracrocinitomix mangrovi]